MWRGVKRPSFNDLARSGYHDREDNSRVEIPGVGPNEFLCNLG